ncbi:MAG: hypothetical protein JWO36_6607 [Myxococcales bacterium]|nr:hypothetical protein [Myxococcales bacterium]
MRRLAIAWAALISVVVACGGAPQHRGTGNLPKENEITALWTQIRDWRREAHMELDPTRQTIFQWRGRSIPEAKNVCPEAHPVPATCTDVCSLAENICDNAESICNIADELGKEDEYAQDKCGNAKASCREAKQRCCTCSGGTT